MFENHACGCFGQSQGARYVATTQADSTGYWEYNGNVPPDIAATTTHPTDSNTSEFSFCVMPLANEETVFDKPGIHLYPNPASNQISLAFPKEWTGNEIVVELLSFQGQPILTNRLMLKYRIIEVDIRDLAAGIYYFSIRKEGVVGFTALRLAKY